MEKKNTQEIDILKETENYIAVSKPAGWLTVPGRGNKEDVPVLSHEVGRHLRHGERRNRAGGIPDLYTVHRLDEGTSGVIIFAKDSNTHKILSHLFESHEVKKTYWCFVKGKIEDQLIDAPLFKIPSKKIKSVVAPNGKPSQTLIHLKEFVDGFSLVSAQPKTGRSHQIRVHLAHVGFPILGDRLYGGLTEAFGSHLLFPLLHARELEFDFPAGTKTIITAPLKGPFLTAATGLGLIPSCTI